MLSVARLHHPGIITVLDCGEVDSAAESASDGRLRSGLASYTPEYIRAIEARFEQRFGIRLRLENEPGHSSREIPPKILQAQKAGKADHSGDL